MTNEFLYDNKIFDGTPPSLRPSPILPNEFRIVVSNQRSYLSYLSNEEIKNNKQADIFNNFSNINSTDSSTPLTSESESESECFTNDKVNNFNIIGTGKYDKFENNIQGENNTLDCFTEKSQKQSDEYKNKICDEINLKGNKKMLSKNLFLKLN